MATVRHDASYDELSTIAPTVFVKTTGPQWRENAYKTRAKTVADEIWMTSVSVHWAHLVLDDLAATFGTDNAPT